MMKFNYYECAEKMYDEFIFEMIWIEKQKGIKRIEIVYDGVLRIEMVSEYCPMYLISLI